MMKSPALKKGLTLALFGGLLAMAQSASAVYIDPNVPIPTQLLKFGTDLSPGILGEAFLPLTNAATTSTAVGAPAATGDGYGWVKSNISVTLSSQRTPTPGPATVGEAFLGVPFGNPNGVDATASTHQCLEGAGVAGNVETGDSVCVTSNFNVYFDVTVTDTDSTASFLGGAGPASITLLDNGPMLLSQFGSNECIADTSKPNLGCLPVTGDAYIGHFRIVLAVGDVNGNGSDDVIKFDFVQHQVGDVTNTFVDPNALVVNDSFNSNIGGGGSVEDSITDPPFTFTLTGPTTAQQGIVYPAQVPEPASMLLLVGGLGVMFGFRKRGARQDA